MRFLAALTLCIAALASLSPAPGRAEGGQPRGVYLGLEASGPQGDPLLSLALMGELRFDPHPVCTLRLEDTRLDLAAISGAATGEVEAALRPGGVDLRRVDLTLPEARLLLGGQERTAAVRVTGSGTWEPDAGRLELTRAALHLDGGLRLSGSLAHQGGVLSGRLALSVRDAARAARLLGDGFAAALEALGRSGPVVADFRISHEGEAWLVRSFSVAVPARLVRADAPEDASLPRLDLSLRAQPGQCGGWAFSDLRVGLGGLVLRGDANLDSGGRVRAALGARGVGTATAAPLLRAFTGVDVSHWSPSGTLDLDAALDTRDGNLSANMDLRVEGLGYMSPMADQMAQGGRAHARLALASSASGLALRASLDAPEGEVLVGPYYVNLGAHPLQAYLSGSRAGPDRWRGLDARLDWQGFGSARARGDLRTGEGFEDWRGGLELAASQLDLGALFDLLAEGRGLENLQGEHGLAGTGALTLHLDADEERADLSGRITLSELSLSSADGSVDVERAGLELPLRYRLRGEVVPVSPQYVPPGDWGKLTARNVRAGPVQLDRLENRVALVPNRFFLADGVALPLLGGEGLLGTLRVDQPLSRDFRLAVTAGARGLDLSRASTRAAPLAGTLSGSLGEIVLTRERLSVPGALTGSFFGGDTRVDGLFATDPFAAHRRMGGSLSVRGLDLELLSDALDIGRVTGLMDLDLHDLVVAYGEPVSMRLRAETSGQGDFEKSVSLKAVNTLSVIGTGSGIGSLGVGMFARFFEEFSYARIGFQCTLNNDTFRVRGLIREDGVEYLIKKPFLTGINVVNSNPKNHISFKDMRERVERVLAD